jgi:hypothetical protein
VATDWAPIVQTSIGAGAALGGGFIGAWTQARYQRHMERDRRCEEAGAVLAEVRVLLSDMEPDPLGLFATAETLREMFPPLQERWQRIRVPLLTVAMVHQVELVGDLARQLERSTTSALIGVALFVRSVVDSRDLQDTRELANSRHQQAISLLTQLEEAIQRA